MTPLGIFISCIPQDATERFATQRNAKGELPLHILLKNQNGLFQFVRGQQEEEEVNEQFSLAFQNEIVLVASLNTQSVVVYDPIEGLVPFMMAAIAEYSSLDVIFQFI
jgi:hypothetical protein